MYIYISVMAGQFQKGDKGSGEKSKEKVYSDLTINPHQNDQGRNGPCFFQRLIALKCLKCQKLKKYLILLL
jgi:hypothetical protein